MAVVERVKQESMYGLPVGPKKMAVVEKWSFVEVPLYYWRKPLNISHRKKILTEEAKKKGWEIRMQGMGHGKFGNLFPLDPALLFSLIVLTL